MEDDKKKKKNKKKKNKQQAKSAAEDVASDAGNTSSQEQSILNQCVDSADNVGDKKDNLKVEDKGRLNAEAINGSHSAEDGKQNWLQEEARLRDMVKQLLYEKDSYIQRQADLEMKVTQLQGENDSWHQKEVLLEQRISQLLQEQASLNFEKRDLQEKIGHIEKEKALLGEKENSSKEMIAALDNENSSLRMKVGELEGARSIILEENGQLLDNISMLQSRIQDLEMSLASAQSSVDAQKDVSEKEDLNAQIEEACALIEKLVTENAELVEKMNELYMDLGSLNVGTGEGVSVVIPDSATIEDHTATSSGAANAVELSEQQYSMETEQATNVIRHSPETAMSGEIVQIALDENETHRHDLEAQPPREDDAVPITDAPLTGAPFRLVSFVARYMSGADLVNKSSSDTLQ